MRIRPYSCQKRLAADKKLLPKIMNLYDRYCPEVKEILYSIEDFGILTAVSSNTYELTEDAYLTSFGAALWIMDQAISHASYYKIMNEARRLHIPVHCFTYPPARNCAEQIVIQDQK